MNKQLKDQGKEASACEDCGTVIAHTVNQIN